MQHRRVKENELLFSNREGVLTLITTPVLGMSDLGNALKCHSTLFAKPHRL